MSGLRLVHARQVACWPWHIGWLPRQAVQYATCRTCERDVAQPLDSAGEVPVCVYCGLESGLLVAVDAPLMEPLHYADGRHHPETTRERPKRA